MVGYNPELKINKADQAKAGAISNVIARAVTQPFDVLKIRFQLQLEPISAGSSSSKYQSLLQAVKCMVREEGPRALWKGHLPAQCLSVSFGVVEFVCFENITKHVWFHLPHELSTTYKPLTHAVSGGMSSCLATVVVQPIDIIRTRLVAQGEPKVYRSMYHAAESIIRLEGVRGFYKGLIPACIGVAPQMGLQFGFYALLQRVWNTALNLPYEHHPGGVESFICGSGSGFISKLLIYPMDLTKKRLQVQGFEDARKRFGAVHQYRGLAHCLSSTLQHEGVRGLYKGLAPSLLKAVFATGTIFCVYDQVCFFLANR
ncbi:mitochondrial thiamine pyrophosphate carrier-like [Dreissena polymorpha]|uniref:Mitochondrial thiamine pyrophosphate carrier n=1 Tax=Dreissena polymorpha TaxID=45954 RepID=A0A9D4M857_DREPO|nr:mitochondrial thiamine pyrophosphate carrier-like [Dreissena polymorpha]XP_052266487.1 mitochondrial thiamine pyrophosphate carrier-like [Dreissena polymorpha]XP_052266488.1 mitochondrial thiamine pyrophosphate carrier-like [Dreissena polymorpha]XP_052266489.1 mitochondrial thiamine pyrophosphate carrier-like [Dreissena polymorpha]XP_052266490.1 mitochondrial thiamine pyrophosphate carrier-like [Dreissena polymorpha]XP_052266491.1 mitochondrial thiamine pyrophosphate carrier-like [Dreissena